MKVKALRKAGSAGNSTPPAFRKACHRVLFGVDYDAASLDRIGGCGIVAVTGLVVVDNVAGGLVPELGIDGSSVVKQSRARACIAPNASVTASGTSSSRFNI
ncbi:MAG: hypothetical protein WD208_06725 [Dehalococcoidia bacterium]